MGLNQNMLSIENFNLPKSKLAEIKSNLAINALNLQLRSEVMISISQYLDYLKDLGVSYVGYREFYRDGTSAAFCSNIKWYDVHMQEDMCIHYSQELIGLKRRGHRYIIRSSHDTHNRFLQKLKEQDMCNSLIIYAKEKDMIRMYSFIASLQNDKVINFFINRLSEFEKIANLYSQNLREIFNKDIYFPARLPLLSSRTIDNVLDNSSILTEREKECVANLVLHYSNKEIANKLNVTTKTVEYYLQKIKEKLSIHSRFQIIGRYKNLWQQENKI
ncbi:MAG: response regulator transcription factor [Janthinobacterium lividum]